MDKLTSKKALLELIRLSEGAKFKYDENAIFEEYTTQGENKSSLAIKILSIFGGFIATLAFLGFFAIAELYNFEYAFLLFGIGFIISAIWLTKEFDKLIIDTFSVSIYIIGFALLPFGLLGMKVDENIIVILISLIAFSSLIIAQNFILSFISILAISGSFLFLIIFNKSFHLIHLYVAINTLLVAYFFLNEAKIISSNKKLSKLYNPVRIGLVISLLFGLIIIGNGNLLPKYQNHIWFSSIVMVFTTIYLVYIISRINEIESIKSKILIYFLSGLMLILTIFSPAILGAIIIVLLSFLVNYKTGLVIGVISFIYFISQFYYDLNFTLLNKSIILFSSGIVFLLFYLFTTKKLNTNEKI